MTHNLRAGPACAVSIEAAYGTTLLGAGHDAAHVMTYEDVAAGQHRMAVFRGNAVLKAGTT